MSMCGEFGIIIPRQQLRISRDRGYVARFWRPAGSLSIVASHSRVNYPLRRKKARYSEGSSNQWSTTVDSCCLLRAAAATAAAAAVNVRCPTRQPRSRCDSFGEDMSTRCKWMLEKTVVDDSNGNVHAGSRIYVDIIVSAKLVVGKYCSYTNFILDVVETRDGHDSWLPEVPILLSLLSEFVRAAFRKGRIRQHAQAPPHRITNHNGVRSNVRCPRQYWFSTVTGVFTLGLPAERIDCR